DGALAVPEDWNEPLPESARRSPDEMPEREDEVVSGRDAFTEVWENTDGTETVDLHTEAVHYRPDDGRSWEPIDNSLVPVAERPGWVQNAANSWTVRFGPIEPGGLGGVELVT